ncbi:hypothetical protein A2U01_0034666, partial [Trifolium medium]|nr:hypothetical protein [Trifolium medium]
FVWFNVGAVIAYLAVLVVPQKVLSGILGLEARSASGAQEKLVARREIPMRCNIV